MENWQKKLLDVWWPYSMLLILLYNVETSAERKIVETGNSNNLQEKRFFIFY